MILKHPRLRLSPYHAADRAFVNGSDINPMRHLTRECEDCGERCERDPILPGRPYHCTDCGWIEGDEHDNDEG